MWVSRYRGIYPKQQSIKEFQGINTHCRNSGEDDAIGFTEAAKSGPCGWLKSIHLQHNYLDDASGLFPCRMEPTIPMRRGTWTNPL